MLAPLHAQYAGSASCAKCHAAIATAFAGSAMGRSMRPANAFPLKAPVSVGAYQVFEKDGSLFQKGPGGEFKLEYLFGSGVNGETFAARRWGLLVEAPLTYFPKPGKWDYSPGFENAAVGFSRPVAEGCIVCHSGTRPEGSPIGCESCHGPGAAHVARPVRSTIVNPARLSAHLADDVCMYCHQGGDARVLQPGKHYADFHPGEALNETLAIFKLPPKGDSDLLEHHSAIRLSKCYRASGGKLSCLTCHDPHQTVNYNARCLECHPNQSHPVAVRAGGDCVTCHMPKRVVAEIPHAALTNHRIVIRPGEPLPAVASESIYFNGEESKLPALTRLEAYWELLPKAPDLQRRYVELLNSLAHSMPENSFVRESLGRLALLQNRPAEAIEYLKDAQAAPSLVDLAQVLKLAGREQESIGPLERATKLEPYNVTARKLLIVAYINAKDYVHARTSLEKYVEDFPEDTFMREMLRKVGAR
jgi:hypothetical protein